MPSRFYMRETILLRLAVFVLLSAAVFGWGLNSKLSLYRATEIRVMANPVAKLLSQKERSGQAQANSEARPENDRPERAFSPAALSLFLLAQFFFPAGFRRTGYPPLSRMISARKTRLHLVSLFFRPPPSLQFCR